MRGLAYSRQLYPRAGVFNWRFAGHIRPRSDLWGLVLKSGLIEYVIGKARPRGLLSSYTGLLCFGTLLLGCVQDASLHALALLLLSGQQVSVLHQRLPGQQLLFLVLRKLSLCETVPHAWFSYYHVTQAWNIARVKSSVWINGGRL